MIDKDGRILTNAHVVAGASSVVVAFEDGVSAKATVLGRDSLYDPAVIKVDVPQSELHPLRLGTVSSVQVGDPVVAIGNPFGYAQTVTAGIVSAKGRLISSPAGNDKFIPGAIQTDAAINHGNSGGPLIDRHGNVIAINAQIADPQITGTDANAGVGFAIPIDLAKRALANLEAGKPASHPYLGIRVDALNPSVSAASSKLPSSGLLIAGVAKHSPAAAAGLKGGSQSLDVGGQQYCVGGDVITSIDGHAVATLDDLQERLSSFAAGDKLQLGITGGDGSKRTVTIKVGSIPAQRQPLATGCDPQIRRSAVEAETGFQRAGRSTGARYADGVIAEVFEVEGVRCPRCIEKIAAALSGVEGLLAADANLMGEISVRLDGPAAHERVRAALEDAGFPVAAVRPAA